MIARGEHLIQSLKKTCSSYDKHSDMQYRVASTLGFFIKDQIYKKYESILEIGCGTGILTQKMIEKSLIIDDNTMISDISPEMLQICKQKINNHTGIKFSVIDGEKSWQLPYRLIVSSMVVHWFMDLYAFISKAIQKKKIICFSLPLSGSLIEWKKICTANKIKYKLLEFTKIESVKKKISNSIIQTYQETFEIEYESVHRFLMYLKNTGPPLMNTHSTTQGFFPILNQNISITFNIGYFIIIPK